MKTKIYSLLLLLLGLLPGSIFAQTTYHYTDTDGLTWDFQLDGTGGATLRGVSGSLFTSESGGYTVFNKEVLRLPSNVSIGTNNYPVRELSLSFFKYKIEKVIIPATVNTPLSYSFSHTCIRRIETEPGCQIPYLGSMALAGYLSEFPDPMEGALYFDFSDCPFVHYPWNSQFYETNDNTLLFTNAVSDVEYLYRRKSTFTRTDNIVRAGVCATLHIDDEESFESPRTFTATQASYDRVFSNVAGKAVSTLYLPYPTDLPNGMRAYTLIRKGFDENGDKAFCFAPVPDGTRLEAYKPYLVQITDGASHTLPTMHNVTVPATPDIESTAVMASADSDWKFYGTTLRIKNDKAYAKKAYYLNGNKWWAVQNGVTNDYIAPFRCFISSPTGAAPAKSFLMVLDEEDNNTTGIKSLENKTNEDIKSGKYPFYSVDGKLMGNDYNALESGQIYIVNGKKFYKI